MVKTKFVQKILLIVLVCLLVLCVGIYATLSYVEYQRNNGVFTDDQPSDGKYKFVFGQTYTIDGVEYTLGNGEEECIDYHTALGVDKHSAVTLTKFTYPDGTDGTEETTSVRHAGTYEFEIQTVAANGKSEIVTMSATVGQQKITVDVNAIPLFINAASGTATLHGDYLTIYHSNTGWYMSKLEDDLFIESKVITNGYMYADATKKVAMLGETNPQNAQSSVNLNFVDDAGRQVPIEFEIINKTGNEGTASQEYLAVFYFKFNSPNGYSDYTLEYGDELVEEFKHVEIIPNKSTIDKSYDFIVTKSWFMITNGNLFADALIIDGGKTNEPYSPFGFGDISSTLVNNQPSPYFSFVNTVTYLDQRDRTDTQYTTELSGLSGAERDAYEKYARGIQVRVPRYATTEGGADAIYASSTANLYFSVKYTPVGGESVMLTGSDRLTMYRPVTKNASTADTYFTYDASLYSQSFNESTALAYYFNYTMPAGTYVLTIYNADHRLSEYTLYVKPKAFTQSEIDAITQALTNGLAAGKSFNEVLTTKDGRTYPSQLHDNIDGLVEAVTLSSERLGYWKQDNAFVKGFFDKHASLKYNRRVWAYDDYATLEEMQGEKGSLSTTGEYTFYYSINAKNYVTVGGGDDVNRLKYVFTTKLTSVVVSPYVHLRVGIQTPYFQNVVYIGNGTEARTLVPTSDDYYATFKDTDIKSENGETLDYVNVRQGASVTLRVIDHNTKSFADPNSQAVKDIFVGDVEFDTSRFSWDPDNPAELVIYYDIVKAENGFRNNVAPSLTSWQYGNFDKTVNLISYNLLFDNTVHEIGNTYFRIGTKSGSDAYNWIEMYDNSTEKVSAHPEYFQLDANGQISDEKVIAELNKLVVGTNYYLGIVVEGGDNVEDFEAVSNNPVTVLQAQNAWTINTSISSWTYGGFAARLFTRGIVSISNIQVNNKFEPTYTIQPVDSDGNVVSGSFVEGFQDLQYDVIVNELENLDAGSYNLRAYVPNSINYASVSETTIRFTVRKADDSWMGGAPTITGWIYGSYDSAQNAPTPEQPQATILDGTATFAYYTTELDGGLLVRDDIVSETDLSQFDAGTYMMVVTVEGNTNYNDLVAEVIFTISKNANTWIKELADYTGHGKVVFSSDEQDDEEAVFALPVAPQESIDDIDLLRFDVVQVGGYGRYNLDRKALKEYFEGSTRPTRGTFAVTARIGGTFTNINSEPKEQWDKFEAAVKKYNTNYEALTTTCTITLSPMTNSWSREFAGNLTWDWHGTSGLEDWEGTDKKPQATYGDDTVVYVITYGNGSTKEFRASEYQVEQPDAIAPAKAAFADLIAFITNDLDAGSYILTASVEGTDLYESPGMLSVMFTINPITTKWNSSVNNYYRQYEWKYGATDYIDQLKRQEPLIDDSIVLGTWGTIQYKLESATSSVSYNSWEDLVGALDGTTFGTTVKTVGTYTLSAHIDSDINHTELSYSVTVTIVVADNKWNIDQTIGGDSDQLQFTWIYGGTYDTIAFVPEYADVGELTVTINNVPYEGNNINDEFKNRDAGTYIVTATVAANDKYGVLTRTITITINQAENRWADDYSPDVSFHNGEGDSVIYWYWEDKISWTGIKPIHGYKINIVIYLLDSSYRVVKTETSGAIRVDDADSFEARLSDLKDRISGILSTLNVGTYCMVATVDGDTNWSGIADSGNAIYNESTNTRVLFEVRKPQNEWKHTPEFPGLSEDSDGIVRWAYNTSVSPLYEAAYGVATVRYSYYYPEDGNQSWTEMPTNVGTYIAEFSVEGTDNYDRLDMSIAFEITKADDRGFERTPSVNGWVWGTYDKEYNLFYGKPNSGGDITFEIVDSDGNSLSPAIKFRLVDSNGVHDAENLDNNIYVSQSVITKLNALKDGTYKLRVHVDGTNNYEQFDFYDEDVFFNVTEASNYWVTLPYLGDWVQGQWKREANMPQGQPYYGEAIIEIHNNSTQQLFFKATVKANGDYNEEYNILEQADIGYYTMTISVAGSLGEYSGLDTYTQYVRVYAQGTGQNAWDVVPAIEDWVADIVNGEPIFRTPTARPLLGKAYFEFYKIIDGDNTKKVGPESGIEYVTILAGITYAKDFYIPTEPGRYYMYAYATIDGDEQNRLESSRITLTIDHRVNMWETSVTIDSVLELGNKANWVAAFAEASLTDSVDIEYTYFYADGTKYGKTIPTEVGSYYVIATARAKYCIDLTSRKDFEIVLSQNSWEELPFIEGWSEEFNETSPAPKGSAAVGEVVFTYIDEDGVEHTEKPTTAGNYTLRATVEYEGYDKLVAEYNFVVDYAFDVTFLRICIILASIASVLAGVVIYFAIRRNREN